MFYFPREPASVAFGEDDGDLFCRADRPPGKATITDSCVKVEVAVLDSPSLISPVVSVDVKQH